MTQNSSPHKYTKTPGRAEPDRNHVPAGEKQRFIKNNRYFTICVYASVMVLIAAIIFKCIIDIDKTKAWLRQRAS